MNLKSDIYLFLIFSAFIILVYYVVPKKWGRYILLAANLLFYAMCDYRFLVLVCAEVAASYYFGMKTAEYLFHEKHKSKWNLICGVGFTVMILCTFKYYRFFVSVTKINLPEVIMPVGISYFSFRIISYLADIYSGKRAAESSFTDYAVYIGFFPHLLCGPIARSGKMLAEIKSERRYNAALFSEGCQLIIYGVFKKAVIADRLGSYVNLIFDNPQSYPALALWMGAIGYSIQLYCDFSGYSDVAIGITNLLGFSCDDNFRRPYLSKNIKEFWSRWHISLSGWLRDYIYIPLGGNRTGYWKKIRNVMITFLICGIWHGSELHYLVWGAYHGALNLLYSTMHKKNKGTAISGGILGYLFTFPAVMVGWIFFRAESTTAAIRYIIGMFSGVSLAYDAIVASIIPFTGDNSCVAYFITLVFMVLLLAIREIGEEKAGNKRKTIWGGIMLFCIIFFSITGGSSFLYANY